MDNKLIFEDLSYKIIGAAMEVHKVLGHGFLEAVYEEALGYEFEPIGLQFEGQKELKIKYKGRVLNKKYKANYVVEGKVIVEIKATNGLIKSVQSVKSVDEIE